MGLIFVVGVDKKVEKIYTSARKQMLISSLPPVITLHLKRFHQVRTCYLFLVLHYCNFVSDAVCFCILRRE